MNEDLQQTVTRATQGDRIAIEALLEHYLPDVRSYLARHAGAVVRAREEADDLAQSVCREVLERLADERIEYQGEGQFRKWLYQAAVHKLQNRHRHYRSDKRDALRDAIEPGDESSPPLAELAESPTTASMHAMRREDSTLLRQSLAGLPERDRQVIEWCHFEQLGHRDVAERLGVTETHSRVLLARAMARLAVAANRLRSAPDGAI